MTENIQNSLYYLNTEDKITDEKEIEKFTLSLNEYIDYMTAKDDDLYYLNTEDKIIDEKEIEKFTLSLNEYIDYMTAKDEDLIYSDEELMESQYE
jgi:1,4-dihydroxy-2-naphthoate octaprenyltransferase